MRFLHFFVDGHSPHVTLPPPAIIREQIASVIAHCSHWIFSAENSWFPRASQRVDSGFFDRLIIEIITLRLRQQEDVVGRTGAAVFGRIRHRVGFSPDVILPKYPAIVL